MKLDGNDNVQKKKEKTKNKETLLINRKNNFKRVKRYDGSFYQTLYKREIVRSTKIDLVYKSIIIDY